jgi:16S rRNA (cytosine1402-N4)-methyltransferase
MSASESGQGGSQHQGQPHRRRQRYPGTHPRKFGQRYKELAADRYPEIVQEVRERGGTPAGTHIPVLMAEIMAALQPKAGETVADGTLGFGGHASEFLDRTAPDGRLYGFDMDGRELERTRERLARFGDRISFQRSNFAGIAKVMSQAGIDGYDIVFADLGISSMQIDNPMRGFSYKFDGPLDMRMDDRNPRSAADLLMTLSEQEIAEALDQLADEPDHRAIARHVVRDRAQRPIRRTSHLTRIIFEAKGISTKQWRERAKAKQHELHPAARTFQAMRILVNDELGSLRQFMRLAPACLRPGGRIGIICFQSGEERVVNSAFKDAIASGLLADAIEEPIRPTSEERFNNPRSASARFYWARRNT